MSPDLLADLKRLHLKLDTQQPPYPDREDASAWVEPSEADEAEVRIYVRRGGIDIRVGSAVTEIARKTATQS